MLDYDNWEQDFNMISNSPAMIAIFVLLILNLFL